MESQNGFGGWIPGKPFYQVLGSGAVVDECVEESHELTESQQSNCEEVEGLDAERREEGDDTQEQVMPSKQGTSLELNLRGTKLDLSRLVEENPRDLTPMIQGESSG